NALRGHRRATDGTTCRVLRPVPKQIVSPSNPTFRELLALAGSARERRRLGLTVIEGLHLLQAFVTRHGAPLRLFLPQRSLAAIETERHGELAQVVAATGIEPVVLADRLFAQASQVANGPGPIAVVATPLPPLPGRLDADAVYL